MSIFSGKVALDNLAIKETALMEHQIPFRVEKGTIKKISASIPYTKLKSQPCEAAVDEIFVLGTLAGKVLMQSDSNTNNFKNIPDEYSELDEALQNENVSKSDFTTGIIGSIIDNLRVIVSNIHIRLEYESGNRKIAIGIMIPLIKVCTIDGNNNEIDVNNSDSMIQKKLVLSNLSIYVDTECSHLTDGIRNQSIDFQTEMKKLMQANHQFILHNFSFEVIYNHFKSGAGPIQFGNILQFTATPINLSIDLFQYRCFVSLQNENNKFNRKRFYASCGRPDEFPTEDSKQESDIWWRFLTRCSYKKKHPFTFNPQKALIFLKKRQKTFDALSQILLNPNPKKDDEYLSKLQEKYGGDVVLMFRAYAKMRTERHLRDSKKKNAKLIDLKSKELKEIVSQKDFIKNNSDTLGVQFKITEINVSLSFSSQMPLLLLQWKNWKGVFEMNKSDISLDAEIGDLFVLSKIIQKHILDINGPKGNSVNFHLHGNITNKFLHMDASIASPHFYLDIPTIFNIDHFFGSTSNIIYEEKVPTTRKRNMTDLEVESIFENHFLFEVNVHLVCGLVTIPYKQNNIGIEIGNIDMKSLKRTKTMSLQDVDSWYDKYSINMVGFNLKLDNVLVINPMSINLDLEKTLIRRNDVPMVKAQTKISNIDFVLTREHYCLLLSLPEFLADSDKQSLNIKDLYHLDDVVPTTPKPIDKQFDMNELNLSLLFNCEFESISLDMNNMNAKINDIKGGLKAIQNMIISNFSLKNVLITSQTNQILAFGDANENAIVANLLLSGKDISVTLKTAEPILRFDVVSILFLYDFFKLPRVQVQSSIQTDLRIMGSYFNSVASAIINPSNDLNEYQIQRLLENHLNLKLDIHCTAPKIILPISNSSLIANLGSLHIFTKDRIKKDIANVESYYDSFFIELGNMEIIGDDHEHLLKPFSTSIEIDKSFIKKRSVKQIRVNIDFHELDLFIKPRNCQSLITVIDQILKLYFTINESEVNNAMKVTTIYKNNQVSGFEQAFLDNNLSFLVNLNFKDLQIALLNEDRSVHSSFVMNNLIMNLESSESKNLNAVFCIGKLKALSENIVLLSFCQDKIDSVTCKLNIVNDKILIDFHIIEPIINLYFDKILQLISFIEVPIDSIIYLINNIQNQLELQEGQKKSIPFSTNESKSELKAHQSSKPDTDSNTKANQICNNNSSKIQNQKPLILDEIKKNNLSVTCKFDKIQIISPVLYEQSTEILVVEVNGQLKVDQAINVNVESLTAHFNNENGTSHPPFILNISTIITYQSNVVAIATNPNQTLITVAIQDIASLGVFIKSLLHFIDFIPIKSSKQNKVAHPNDSTVSMEINKLQLQLNSDRYQAVPLFRFCIKQINFIYTMNAITHSYFQFDGIDFMDLTNFNWKMLIEPFSWEIMLNKTISSDMELSLLIMDPINVNFAYTPIQMIIKYVKMISKMMSSKMNIVCQPPSLTIQNHTSELILINNSNEINPNCSHEFPVNEAAISISIHNETQTVDIRNLHYPIFFSKSIVISRETSEKGTTLIISSVLLFDNLTEYPLYLLKQDGIRTFSNLLSIPSNELSPLPCENSTYDFALTTERNELNRFHDTFTIKQMKNTSILVDCIFPKNRSIKLVISCKFNPLTCSMRVKIEPNCIIKNQLPAELMIKPADYNKVIRIKEGESVKSTLINAANDKFSGYFAAGNFKIDTDINPLNISELISISTKDGSTSPIDVTFMPDGKAQIVQIAVKAEKNQNKPQINLIFFAPAVIFNRSGFNLGCAETHKGKITRTIRFSPRTDKSNVSNDGLALWSTNNYFADKHLPLFVFLNDKNQIFVDDNSIECTVGHIEGPIMIPSSTSDFFYPLHYSIIGADNSKIMTITAQCLITSYCQNPFYIQPIVPKDGNSIIFGGIVEIVPQTEKQKIEIASLSLLYAFRNSPDAKNYTILNFSEPIHTTFVIDGKLYEIETQPSNLGNLITIKTAIFPQPLNLLNDLEIGNEEIYITQKSSKLQWKSKAKPQTMSIIAYDEPFGGTDLTLHYQNVEIPVNMIAVNSPVKYKDIYYEVVTNKNRKTIIVSRKPIIIDQKKGNIMVKVETLNVSIIDKLNHEFCLIRLQQIDFSYTTKEFNVLQFRLKSLQLDDLHPASVLKVVAAGYPEDQKNSLIDLSISMFPNAPIFTACQDISLKIDPLVAFLDVSFLSDFISLMETMFKQEDSYSNMEPQQFSVNALNSIPLTAKSLSIHEIQITVFIRTLTSRPMSYKSLVSYLKAIPDITNATIDLPSFHFEDCTMNAAYIEKDILRPIIYAGMSQWFKLLFHTDIFMRSTGTKSANFARKGERLMNGELQVLIQVPGSIILQGGETFANAFSKVAHMTAFDNSSGVNRVNTTAKATMVSGVKALGGGFKEGITGIVTQPMKMGQESGIGGAIVGLGKGLIGLVAKPVAGVLDASVASIAAARKAINNEDADVIPPMRSARALPMVPMIKFDPFLYQMKDSVQLNFQLTDIESLYYEWIDFCVIDFRSYNIIGVTQKYVFLANEKGAIIESYHIRNIINIQFNNDSSTITISVKQNLRNKEMSINVENQKLGKHLSELINSRRIPLGLGE